MCSYHFSELAHLNNPVPSVPTIPLALTPKKVSETITLRSNFIFYVNNKKKSNYVYLNNSSIVIWLVTISSEYMVGFKPHTVIIDRNNCFFVLVCFLKTSIFFKSS